MASSEQDIFIEALTLSNVTARTKYLEGVCGEDLSLRQRLEELLRLHESADSVLDRKPQEIVESIVCGAGSTDGTPHEHTSCDGMPHEHTATTLTALQPFLQPATQGGSIGRIGHYELLEVLGQGGYGIVFKGFDTKLSRLVAVKVILPHLATTSPPRKRFLREARAAGAVRDGNVAQIYAVEESPIPYLVMEFVSGETAQQRSDRVGPFDPADVVRLGVQIARGLSAAHERGLIHRDIKPGNILIEEGFELRAKITDFGLARTADDAHMSQSGAVIGTPMYMSPEQVLGEEVDQRTDLFSFGSVLYLMTAGRPPFRAPTTLAVLKRVSEDTPRSLRDVMPGTPEGLCEVIARLHSKSRDERYATAQEVIAALETCLTTPVLKRRRRASDRYSAKVWKRWAAALIAVLLVGFIVSKLTGWTHIWNRPREIVQGPGTLDLPAAPTLPASVGPSVSSVKDSIPTPGADRRFAEYVLSIGGAVAVNGEERVFNSQAMLPTGQFTLTEVYVVNKPVNDGALAVGKDCRNLKKLTLADSPVTDAGLANFKDCVDLVGLYLYWTQVTDAGLLNFKECKALTDLDLGGTQVSDAGLVNFAGLTGMTNLRLGGTKVTDVGLVNFTGATGLTDLFLYDTAVTDAGLAIFKGCTALRRLALYRTQVTDAGLANFQGSQEIEELHLCGLKITDVGLANFKGSTRLWYASLYDTQITGAGLANFEGCNGLKELHLGNTQVTDDGLANFKRSTGLTRLSIYNTRVTDAGLTNFRDCRDLIYLDLSDTQVTADCLQGFKGLASLRDVRLRGIRLTDKSVEHVKACKGLRYLDVRNTGIAAELLEILQDAVPGCSINHDGGTTEGIDVDRGPAEHVLSIGGSVRVNGEDRDIKSAADLPKDRFTLTWVILNGNQHADAALGSLKGLGGLTGIELSFSSASDGGISHIQNCTGLKRLLMHSTDVTDAGLAHLKNLRELQELALNSTGVTDDGLADLAAHHPDLRNLALGGTTVGDAGLAHLKGLKSLTNLYLPGSNLVTDVGVAHLAPLAELSVLDLRSTRISDAGIASLSGLTKLDWLALAGRGVTDAGLAHLASCRALNFLNVTGTKVTAEGLADFHTAVPGCRIEYNLGTIEPKQ